MGVQVSFESKGLDSLIRNLGRETEKVAAATRQEIAQKARNNAPVRSGRLQRSIAVVGDEVQVGAPYAGVVEAKHPFLQPAVDEAERGFERALEGVIRRLGNG